MTEQFLVGANVVTGIQEVGSESIAKGTTVDLFMNAGETGGLVHGLLGIARADGDRK